MCLLAFFTAKRLLWFRNGVYFFVFPLRWSDPRVRDCFCLGRRWFIFFFGYGLLLIVFHLILSFFLFAVSFRWGPPARLLCLLEYSSSLYGAPERPYSLLLSILTKFPSRCWPSKRALLAFSCICSDMMFSFSPVAYFSCDCFAFSSLCCSFVFPAAVPPSDSSPLFMSFPSHCLLKGSDVVLFLLPSIPLLYCRPPIWSRIAQSFAFFLVYHLLIE